MIEGLLCIYALLYMLWPLRGFVTIITLWDCRFRVSTLSIEHHFCWKSAILSTFMSVAKHSANLLLVVVVVAACVVVQFSHLLSCMWLGVTQSALATRVVEEMSRFSSILLWMLACVSSCWRMIPLHLWANRLSYQAFGRKVPQGGEVQFRRWWGNLR